jgi:hypothetical protein
MRELMIIVGIVIFLVVLVALLTNVFKYDMEGLTNSNRTQVMTSPSRLLPVDVAKNIKEESEKIYNLLNIKTNKANYEDIISNLSDYYDNLILLNIVNSQKTNDGYNLNKIAKYKMIKDALQDSFDFVESN